MWREWEERRNVYKLLVRTAEAKRSLGRTRHRLVDNIKIYLLNVERRGVEWIGVTQSRE
jgi:hypothetical protein